MGRASASTAEGRAQQAEPVAPPQAALLTLLAQGVSVKELAEYLGYTDPGFTLRTYTHLVPSSHQRARAAVDEVFRPGRRRRTSDGLGTA